MIQIFRLNEPNVSADDFKSEVLAVDLKNGHYHSIRESGVPVWRLLLEGHDVEKIIQWLAPAYGMKPEVLAPDVNAFVSELQRLELIVGHPSPAAADPAERPSWLADLSGEYAKPLLESYTDLQDLLLLDPIHEVDLAGWPNKKTDSV